jgi:hypothetical protein
MEKNGTFHISQIYGALSTILLGITLLIGAFSIFRVEPPLGYTYVAISVAGLLFNIYYFCRKCPHVADDSCKYIVFGKIARLFPKGKIGERYTYWDVVVIMLPRIFIAIFPRTWLFYYNIYLFIAFWICFMGSIMLIFSICPTCRNTECPFHKKSSRQVTTWKRQI